MSFSELKGMAGFNEFIAAIVELQDDEKAIALTESDPVKLYRAQGAVSFADKVLELIGE